MNLYLNLAIKRSKFQSLKKKLDNEGNENTENMEFLCCRFRAFDAFIKKLGCRGLCCCYREHEKEVQERVFSFGSQNQNQNNLITKKVEVSAWFTPEIPVSTGPSWYQGLPGLILEVNDNNTTILCTKIVINPTDKSKIKKPKRGKVISNVDFIALQEQKRQEAREMWQARMRRSGGGSPSNNYIISMKRIIIFIIADS